MMFALFALMQGIFTPCVNCTFVVILSVLLLLHVKAQRRILLYLFHTLSLRGTLSFFFECIFVSESGDTWPRWMLFRKP